MFTLEQFVERVNSASVDPRKVSSLSDHAPLVSRFLWHEDVYNLMTWNVLAESTVGNLTGDFGDCPTPSWWSLDSQMGLENNEAFRRENMQERLLQIATIILRFLNSDLEENDYRICCLQECWEELYLNLLINIKTTGFVFHKTHEPGKKYFNVIIFRHGRSKLPLNMAESLQKGLALQYATIGDLGLINLHGSFNGELNIQTIRKALNTNRMMNFFVLVGDTNMQVRPLSEFARNDNGMQMKDFMEQLMKVPSYDDGSASLSMVISPNLYTNFSPMKNVNGIENSDHQDVIAFFSIMPLFVNQNFKYFHTESPDIVFKH